VVVVVGGNATRVRLAPKLPLWVRLLIVATRLLVWSARKLVACRGEVAAVVLVLIGRTLLVRQIGSVPADLLLLGVAIVALAWPDSRRWLVAHAWCGYSRRRILACLTETRADTSRGSLPRCVKSRVTLVGEQFTLRCRVGQSAEQINERVDELRAAARCRDVRVIRDLRKGHRVTVDVLRRDTLAEPVPAFPVPHVTDLFALAIGLTEYGARWLLGLLGRHILIVGVTGAGKSSVIQSMLRQLAPGIRDGVVQVWAVDPKGGMELGPVQALFARFADEDYPAMVAILEEAVAVMKARTRRLKGVTRLLIPTVAEPLIVVLVDEVANLTAYQPDRDLRRRAEAALAMLSTQGRAVGVSVVAALQDPRKEVLNIRNLFPVKIALRLDEPWQVDAVLGDGAREAGARAHLIPVDTPGVGYVRIDGEAGMLRVRASWVSDGDIDALTLDYRPPAEGWTVRRLDQPPPDEPGNGVAA
jgi:S-DNA-T family DNA segregation ATPase FtsK/SpoIIIE